jgi:hypothetical protein
METTTIIVICAFILLLFIIYYELRLKSYEHFTQNNKNILIEMTELPPNKTIGDIINIPHIDLNKLYDSNNAVLTNLLLLDARITGMELRITNNNEYKRYLRTGVTERNIDLSSNDYINVKSSLTAIYKDSDKMMKDPSNIYVAYPHKLPGDFVSSQNMKKIPVSELNFSINNIGELINILGKDCEKDKNCGGFYIALNDKNELIVANIENQIDVSKLRDYPYTMNGDILTSILCVKQPTDKTDLANKMIGACGKFTPDTKDIGPDCFAQVWSENKCDGPQPEYSDTFKSLSYQELDTELKDSKCYTDAAWKRKTTEKIEEKKEEKKEEGLMSIISNLFK